MRSTGADLDQTTGTRIVMKYPPEFKYSIQLPLIQNIIQEYTRANVNNETFEEYANRLYGIHIEYDTHGKNIITLSDNKKYLFAKLKFGV